MEVIGVLINAIVVFMLGLYIKNYLPSYMNEKGKNLATKEDIEEITRKTEEVQDQFKKEFEHFQSDLKFKYDFYYKQYSELYSKLYEIIIQSEYIKHFVILNGENEEELTFDNCPFFEVSPTISTRIKSDLITQKVVETTERKIPTPISQFNKKQLCDYIIEKGQYATQNLLKIAVSYRFAYDNYEGNYDKDNSNSNSKDTANEEELRLIREMVCCIVKEYNFFRKELKMSYDGSELETGIIKLN